MTKMTPREALYNICIELGPPTTNRDDNLTAREVRLRDSIRTLQNFIDYRATSGDSLDRLELEDFHHHHHEYQMTLSLGDEA